MKKISLEEIITVYNAYGLSGNETKPVRNQINMGSLNRKLNTSFVTRNTVDNKTVAVNPSVVKNSSKNINFRLY